MTLYSTEGWRRPTREERGRWWLLQTRRGLGGIPSAVPAASGLGRTHQGHPKAAGGGNETRLSHIPAWTIWALSSSEKRLRSGTGFLFQEKRPTCGSASQGAEPEEEEEEERPLPRRWAR